MTDVPKINYNGRKKQNKKGKVIEIQMENDDNSLNSGKSPQIYRIELISKDDEFDTFSSFEDEENLEMDYDPAKIRSTPNLHLLIDNCNQQIKSNENLRLTEKSTDSLSSGDSFIFYDNDIEIELSNENTFDDNSDVLDLLKDLSK